MITETTRLLLREITVADAEQAYLLNLDPEVIRYTGDEAFKSVEEAEKFLAAYDPYRKYGFGRWAVIDKNTNEFLGWCGLKFHEKENFYDIGFRFFKKHWGKGYATEAALACLDLGFKTFRMPEIIGRAAKENLASIRVLTKIGMQYYREDLCHGENAVIYGMKKD
jgi:[ribosomal protein S5]-alanine N-acetyltransferase